MLDAQAMVGVVIVLITGIAAISDLWKGQIPNWLTLPPLFLAPLFFGWFQGVEAFCHSILAIFVCGAVPLLLFTQRAMGGGDVKLFACIGAIVGARLGLEIQLFSYMGIVILSLGYLAWKGRLFCTLKNSIGLLLSYVLPRKHKRHIPEETLTAMRMGGVVLLATLVIMLDRYSNPWF